VTNGLNENLEAILGKTFNRFTTKGSCTWNITHNPEVLQSESCILSGGDHLLFKYRKEKTCDKTTTTTTTTTTTMTTTMTTTTTTTVTTTMTATMTTTMTKSTTTTTTLRMPILNFHEKSENVSLE
jgi:Tfp pilus assembly major pilin PilA